MYSLCREKMVILMASKSTPSWTRQFAKRFFRLESAKLSNGWEHNSRPFFAGRVQGILYFFLCLVRVGDCVLCLLHVCDLLVHEV